MKNEAKKCGVADIDIDMSCGFYCGHTTINLLKAPFKESFERKNQYILNGWSHGAPYIKIFEKRVAHRNVILKHSVSRKKCNKVIQPTKVKNSVWIHKLIKDAEENKSTHMKYYETVRERELQKKLKRYESLYGPSRSEKIKMKCRKLLKFAFFLNYKRTRKVCKTDQLFTPLESERDLFNNFYVITSHVRQIQNYLGYNIKGCNQKMKRLIKLIHHPDLEEEYEEMEKKYKDWKKIPLDKEEEKK